MEDRDRCPEPVARPTAPDADLLARHKRMSLAAQARQAAWQLGALMRRAEHEAPEVHRRLRVAVEALQLLSARISVALASDRPAPGRPGS